jgi:hypothetical protein
VEWSGAVEWCGDVEWSGAVSLPIEWVLVEVHREITEMGNRGDELHKETENK